MARLKDKVEAGPPLDISQLLRESLVVFANSFWILIALSIAASLSEFLLDGYAFGFDTAAWRSGEIHNPPGFSASSVAVDLLQSAIYGLMAGVVIQVAHSNRLNHENTTRPELAIASRAVIPWVLINAVLIALSYLGIFAMTIAMFWINTVCFVVLPAAVLENSGFNAWDRSFTLTKYYRWPIFLLTVMLTGMLFLFWFMQDIVSATTEATLSQSTVGTLAIGFLDYSLYGAVIMVQVILACLTYFHLVEIKEGPSIDQVAEVFE